MDGYIMKNTVSIFTLVALIGSLATVPAHAGDSAHEALYKARSKMKQAATPTVGWPTISAANKRRAAFFVTMMALCMTSSAYLNERESYNPTPKEKTKRKLARIGFGASVLGLVGLIREHMYSSRLSN